MTAVVVVAGLIVRVRTIKRVYFLITMINKTKLQKVEYKIASKSFDLAIA